MYCNNTIFKNYYGKYFYTHNFMFAYRVIYPLSIDVSKDDNIPKATIIKQEIMIKSEQTYLWTKFTL